MQTILQLLFTTVQVGAVVVLFALGLTLIFGVLRIVNFAHGQFFTLAALTVAMTVPALAERGFSVPQAYLLGCAAGICAATAVGMVVYRFGFRRLERDMIGSFILSAGVVLLLEGLFLEGFGGAVRPVPPLLQGHVDVAGLSVSAQRLLLCSVALVLTLALGWLLSRTRFGRALRAVSLDHEAAMLQGVPYRRVAMQGFLVATVLGAVAGVLTAPISAVSPTLGDAYLVKGFIAVIVGGMGSVSGAIVGSLFIALIESFGGFYLDPSSATLAMFILVMLVLLVRPKGVLGHG